MKKLSVLAIFNVLVIMLSAQALVTPQSQYGRVYTILNTKCQNSSCHTATATDGSAVLTFDGDSDAVYKQIFNKPSQLSASSVAKFEELVYPQQPYQSFLLRKIAGAKFDTDLALDSTGEGAAMLPVQGTGNFPDTLSSLEIEVVRQWIRFGALEVYASTDPQPDYGTIAQYYNDGQLIPFFAKPPAPPVGRGIRLRMGPVFLPTSGPYVEQEWLEQQVVHFPFLPEITRIDGAMNNQSHHFLLFQYPDSASARDNSGNNAAPDVYNVGQVTPPLISPALQLIGGTNSFEGNKNLTGAWQEDANLILPEGTALMWDQKTYLDLNFHVKNYNATSVLPCDFYFNVYFGPRQASTIPMVSQLVNNSLNLGDANGQCLMEPYTPPLGITKFLPDSAEWRGNYADPDNGRSTASAGMRYLWMAAGHTHQWGTGFYIVVQDTFGGLTDTIYNGQYDYTNQVEIGVWDHSHPPIEYWNNGLLPVYVGTTASGIKAGLVANTSYFSTVPCLHFGFTTANEMQLFYYMYTDKLPPVVNSINTVNENPFSLTVIPNPVNEGNGKIVYVLDGTSKVSSVIVDVTGKVISQLNEETEVAGAHEISINSTQRLAAGIYFARLIVDGSAYTKKFVVTN